jgi:hypothetical protein
MTDLKTLRLATLQLSFERLEAFVVYQRTLLAQLTEAGTSEWNGAYAFAHGKALAASKLDLIDLGKLKAMVGAFCGRRSALNEVRERLEKKGAVAELRRLEDLSPFFDRYGAEAVELMLAREKELVQLHRELAHREGGGHLHPVD